MGGRKEEKPKLPGERIAVLPLESKLQPDASLKDMPVSVPAASANDSWMQAGGMLTAETGNLAGGKFDTIIKADAGKGEEFGHIQIPPPVVGGGMVFAMDGIGDISAHDALNVSNVKWTSKGVGEKGGPDAQGGGLAYDQGRIYGVSGRGMTVALDAATGKPIWRKNQRVPFRSAPRIADGRLYAVTLDNQIYAINAGTGDVLWTARGISESARILGSVAPAVSGDIVLAPYSSGELYALSVADGREVWSESLAGRVGAANTLFTGIGGNPVIDGEVVFVVSSGDLLSVFHIQSGQRIWNKPIGSINTPWVAGNYLYMLSTDSTLVCMLKFDGRIAWATRLPEFFDEKKKIPLLWRGPVMVDGKLALTNANGQMLLVSATDGKIVDTKSIPEDIHTPPVIAGGRAYLVSQDATLYELQ